MKLNDTIQILKTVSNAIKDPDTIADKLGIREIFQPAHDIDSDNSMNNNIYAQSESSSEEDNESIPIEGNTSYNDNKNESDNCCNKKQSTSSNTQGVIDSIAQELTSVRLQQAIILSEIVGKPRSKARRQRRRF